MFDYVQKLQLALTDTARRSAMKAVAGLVLAVGAGFMLAALWTWLAYDLMWGATLASLTIGGAFVIIALIMLLMSNSRRHQMPTGDDLRREVEERISFAADAAVGRARAEAAHVMDMAGQRVTSLIDQAGDRASRFAGDAERKVVGAARSVGLTSENLDAAKDKVSQANDSNAGSMAKLIGAFAVGVTVAAKLRESRRNNNRDDYGDDF